MDYKQELSNKKVIVFGGSSGIGLNIASHLIAKDCNIYLSSGNEDKLNTALNDLKKKFPSVKNIYKIFIDLREHGSLDAALSANLKDEFDTIILSSAVLGPSGDFAKMDFTDWCSTFNVNVFGCAKVVHYFLKNNLIRKNGKIIVISGGISMPDPYFTSFSATKHALNGFVYSLSHQLAKKKIWVNSVLPGSFHTRMNEIRINRGPESIGTDNFKLALSRINQDETKQYQKLHHLVEFLCSSISDGIYGRLISAQNDDWQNNIERLKNDKDDLYKIIRKKN